MSHETVTYPSGSFGHDCPPQRQVMTHLSRVCHKKDPLWGRQLEELASLRLVSLCALAQPGQVPQGGWLVGWLVVVQVSSATAALARPPMLADTLKDSGPWLMRRVKLFPLPLTTTMPLALTPLRPLWLV